MAASLTAGGRHITGYGLITAFLALGLGACTLANTVIHNVANLDDHHNFANRHVAAAAGASPLHVLPRPTAFLRALPIPDEDGRVWRPQSTSSTRAPLPSSCCTKTA